MIGVPLSDRARQVRDVEVSSALALTITATSGDYFACRRLPVPIPRRPSDSSPRESGEREKLIFDQAQELGSADRVDVWGAGEYELLSDPRSLRSGNGEAGFEVEVMPPARLYPYEATLEEQGGADVSTVRCAVFSVTERTTDRGDYADYLGQAPIEHEAALKARNRQLHLGARTLKIVSAVTVFDPPHVSLRLRQA